MGKSNHLLASSALFSIILFFYILNLVSFFQPTVYPLIDRVVYVIGFVDRHFVNNHTDSLIIISCTILWFQFSIAKTKKYLIMAAFGITFLIGFFLDYEFMRIILVLMSLPTILMFILINEFLKRSVVSFDWRLSLNYISLFGIAIAIVSAFVFISFRLFPEVSLPSLNYLNFFYVILSIFSPLYLVLITFSYPFVLTFRKLKKKFVKKAKTAEQENNIVKEKLAKRRIRMLHLSVIIFLSIIIAMIPHLGTINKDNQSIGVDTKHYVKLLDSMAKSSGTDELLYKVFVSLSDGDRPFSLLFFFLLSSIFYQYNFSTLLENLPLLLGPLLVITTYFLTLSITRDHLTSLLASLLTIPSHILIGIYAGFYANWFALIWAYLALLFLFKLVDEPKKSNLIVFSILLIILLFTHSQTWTIYMYVIGLFLVVAFFKYRREKKELVIYIIFSILPSIAIEIARLLIIDSSGVKQEITFALQREVGILGLQIIWENLIATTHFTLAGQIANPIILLLVIYWLYSTKIKEKYTIFFIIFFSLFALPLLFADRQIQSRFFYEIPFQIPAAIALVALKERTGSYLTFAICLWLIIMSLYNATNFVLVIHK